MPQATLDSARAAVRDAQNQVMADYESDRAELASKFQLSETEAERESLARALADLNASRDEGLAAIADDFRRARREITKRANRSEARVELESQAMGDLFRGTAAGIGEIGERQVARRGLGVGSMASRGIDELQAAALGSASREQALAQRLGNINVEELRWLADHVGILGEEERANFRGIAQGVAGDITGQHLDRVGARIAQERGLEQQGMMQLMDRRSQQQMQLGQADIGILQQLAQIRQQQQEAAAARAAAAANAAASRAHSSKMARMQQTNAKLERARAERERQAAIAPGTVGGSVYAMQALEAGGPGALGALSRAGYHQEVGPLSQMVGQGAVQDAAGRGQSPLDFLGGLFR